MSRPQTTRDAADPCDDTRLQQLLCGDEASRAFRQTLAHVEVCENCQSRLAELAASRPWWADAKRSLSVDEADMELEREQQQRPWSGCSWQPAKSGSGCSWQPAKSGSGCSWQPAKSWIDTIASQLLAPPSHPEMLGRLGRYEMERLIGSGGMGVVFKAFDSELNRPVAIKVLAPHLAGSGAARKRFAREARAAAAIVHEHVVAIHNVESESEPPYLVMQYVAGESLQARLDREGPLQVCEILRIARQTAAALSAAHQQGLVHRDVKPSNILLEEGVDRALLTDFGLARASNDASLTHSGHVAGTPHYMSPEQARGENADQRSDLFSLGSVLYAMCTGQSPFRAETSYGVLRRITDAPARSVSEVNSEIPLWLGCLIEKLHAKSPRERYGTAAQVAEVLGQCLAHVQQPRAHSLPPGIALLARREKQRSTVAASGKTRPGPAWYRHRSTLLASLAALGGLLLVATLRFPALRESEPPPRRDGGQPVHSHLPQRDDLATKWETVEREVRLLDQQIIDLTERVDEPWGPLPGDYQPAGAKPKPNPNIEPTAKESDS